MDEKNSIFSNIDYFVILMPFVQFDAPLSLWSSIEDLKNQSICNFVVERKFKVCSLTPTKKERKKAWEFWDELETNSKSKIQIEINIDKTKKEREIK
jgi:hypothetical protein